MIYNRMNQQVTLEQLLLCGTHIGHSKQTWNPQTSPYILGTRNNTLIIDLEQTLVLLRTAIRFVYEVSAGGGTVLFVSTAHDYANIVETCAKKCNQPYVNRRWVGGLLTNYIQMKDKLKNPSGCSQKFILSTQGTRNLDKLPDAIFIIGTNNCKSIIHEASLLQIPTIAIIDTNVSVKGITYPIPGNDDSVRTINLYCQMVSNAILSGYYNSIYQE